MLNRRVTLEPEREEKTNGGELSLVTHSSIHSLIRPVLRTYCEPSPVH